LHSIFSFAKILGFDFSALQRKVQPSPLVMISGVWGHVPNKHQGEISGMKFLSGRHLLRKDALLASIVPNISLRNISITDFLCSIQDNLAFSITCKE